MRNYLQNIGPSRHRDTGTGLVAALWGRGGIADLFKLGTASTVLRWGASLLARALMLRLDSARELHIATLLI